NSIDFMDCPSGGPEGGRINQPTFSSRPWILRREPVRDQKHCSSRRTCASLSIFSAGGSFIPPLSLISSHVEAVLSLPLPPIHRPIPPCRSPVLRHEKMG